MKTNVLLVLGCFVLLFFNSCSPKLNTDKGQLSDKIYYPAEADTAHFQFLKGFSTSAEIGKTSKFSEAIIGEKDFLSMIKPYGIAVQEDKIYISTSDLASFGTPLHDSSGLRFSPSRMCSFGSCSANAQRFGMGSLCAKVSDVSCMASARSRGSLLTRSINTGLAL